MTRKNLQAGFLGSGLWPINKDKVIFQQELNEQDAPATVNTPSQPTNTSTTPSTSSSLTSCDIMSLASSSGGPNFPGPSSESESHVIQALKGMFEKTPEDPNKKKASRAVRIARHITAEEYRNELEQKELQKAERKSEKAEKEMMKKMKKAEKESKKAEAAAKKGDKAKVTRKAGRPVCRRRLMSDSDTLSDSEDGDDLDSCQPLKRKRSNETEKTLEKDGNELEKVKDTVEKDDMSKETRKIGQPRRKQQTDIDADLEDEGDLNALCKSLPSKVVDKIRDVEIGTWCIVRFVMVEESKRSRSFIAQVMEVKDNGSFVGDFLRSASTKEKSGYVFKYPDIRDFTPFHKSQIVKMLNPPKPFGKFGLLLFEDVILG